MNSRRPAPLNYDPFEARREARLLVHIDDAKLREAGTTGTKVRVDDLSRSGFKTEWPYTLKVGDRVWLTVAPMGPQAATVRWTNGFTIGCKFDQDLHPAVFEHLIRSLKLSR